MIHENDKEPFPGLKLSWVEVFIIGSWSTVSMHRSSGQVQTSPWVGKIWKIL